MKCQNLFSEENKKKKYFDMSATETYTQHVFKSVNITKTCVYNFDPLIPHFYIVKLGFTRVYNIFLFCSKT